MYVKKNILNKWGDFMLLGATTIKEKSVAEQKKLFIHTRNSRWQDNTCQGKTEGEILIKN
jgi:hypothetical protein